MYSQQSSPTRRGCLIWVSRKVQRSCCIWRVSVVSSCGSLPVIVQSSHQTTISLSSFADFAVSCNGLRGGELGGEGVEREGAEEVAAEAGLDLVEGVAGAFDPGERQGSGEALEFGAQVDVAEKSGRAGVEQQQVFEQQREGAEERGGFLLAVGPGAVGFGHLEEGGVIGFGVSGTRCPIASEAASLSSGRRPHLRR